MLKQSILAAEENQKQTKFCEIFSRSNIRRTTVACAFRPFNQVDGRALVTTFATIILVQSGVANAFRVNVLINCLSLVGQLIGPHLIDKVGRRPVVLFGMLGLLVVNITIGSLGAVGLTSEARRQALAALFIIFQFVNVVTFGSM